MDQNVSIYLNNQTKYSDIVTVQSEDPRFDDFVVRGPLLDQYWQTAKFKNRIRG